MWLIAAASLTNMKIALALGVMIAISTKNIEKSNFKLSWRIPVDIRHLLKLLLYFHFHFNRFLFGNTSLRLIFVWFSTSYCFIYERHRGYIPFIRI